MNIFIIPIEPLETRYTAQWYEHFPKLLIKEATERGHTDVKVHVIDGELTSSKPTEGAFLDFAATNIYKATQVAEMTRFFADQRVNDGDHIVFLDAWHPGIIQMKYMKDLLGVDVNLHGLWHAGSYDPQDFLGRLIKDKRWSNNTEKAMFHSLDYNWFATQFHKDMFQRNVFDRDEFVNFNSKALLTGWPMEYMPKLLEPFKCEKENIILFPHRIAPEKQHDIFLQLKDLMPEYEFITCQDKELTKDEYHELLGRAKMVFSANLQETLGISGYEGALLGAIPFVPTRLSYVEMFPHHVMHSSSWTLDKDNVSIIELKQQMEICLTGTSEQSVKEIADSLSENFFSCGPLLDKIFKG